MEPAGRNWKMGLCVPDYFQRCNGSFQARTMDIRTERRRDVDHARAKAKCETSEWDLRGSWRQAHYEWWERFGIPLQSQARRESLRAKRQKHKDQRQPRMKIVRSKWRRLRNLFWGKPLYRPAGAFGHGFVGISSHFAQQR